MAQTAKNPRRAASSARTIQPHPEAGKVAGKAVSGPETAADQPLLVVIPYLPAGAQGDELELAIAGWREHCKSPYRIVVIGEGLQALEERYAGSDVVRIVESERVPEKPGNYRPHLDYVRCLRKVRALYPDSREFVLSADDCFAVSDFTAADIRRLYVHPVEFIGEDNPYNGWLRDALKTRRLLDAKGLPHRNFTTHLPMPMEWDKWETIVKEYDMDNESYVIEALYYNTYFPESEAETLCHDTDTIRCWMGNGSVPPHDVRLAIGRKIWVCCAVNGYSYIVEDLLKNHYGLD